MNQLNRIDLIVRIHQQDENKDKEGKSYPVTSKDFNKFIPANLNWSVGNYWTECDKQTVVQDVSIAG